MGEKMDHVSRFFPPTSWAFIPCQLSSGESCWLLAKWKMSADIFCFNVGNKVNFVMLPARSFSVRRLPLLQVIVIILLFDGEDEGEDLPCSNVSVEAELLLFALFLHAIRCNNTSRLLTIRTTLQLSQGNVCARTVSEWSFCINKFSYKITAKDSIRKYSKSATPWVFD